MNTKGFNFYLTGKPNDALLSDVSHFLVMMNSGVLHMH